MHLQLTFLCIYAKNSDIKYTKQRILKHYFPQSFEKNIYTESEFIKQS